MSMPVDGRGVLIARGQIADKTGNLSSPWLRTVEGRTRSVCVDVPALLRGDGFGNLK